MRIKQCICLSQCNSSGVGEEGELKQTEHPEHKLYTLDLYLLPYSSDLEWKGSKDPTTCTTTTAFIQRKHSKSKTKADPRKAVTFCD